MTDQLPLDPTQAARLLWDLQALFDLGRTPSCDLGPIAAFVAAHPDSLSGDEPTALWPGAWQPRSIVPTQKRVLATNTHEVGLCEVEHIHIASGTAANFWSLLLGGVVGWRPLPEPPEPGHPRGWIPVVMALPDRPLAALIWDGSHYDLCRFSPKLREWRDRDNFIVNVRYWRPLPAPSMPD